MKTDVDDISEHPHFKVQLDGSVDNLDKQLTKFKNACHGSEKHLRHRCKRRYYNLGLMARVVKETTCEEMLSLLRNGTRTFLVDAVLHTPYELEVILEITNDAIECYKLEDTDTRLVYGLAVELHGDCCRVGRMRNDCAMFLANNERITLTTDESYKNSCFKEIAYVFNLHYYLHSLHVGDILMIGRMHGKVINRLNGNLTVLILEAGVLHSYDYIELPDQCYTLEEDTFLTLFKNDLQIAVYAKAQYVVLPKIRCYPFVKTLRFCLHDKFEFELIGAIDAEYACKKQLDLTSIIELLDYVWIPDMFSVSLLAQNYIFDHIITITKGFSKPIIGSVPLERCSDFTRFESHSFLWKIDTYFIEKSSWCHKYPLIVKKLLPIKDFRMGVFENSPKLIRCLSTYESMVNFVIRSISSIECHAVLVHRNCEKAFLALSNAGIYCPVYILIPLFKGIEEETKINLARSFNMRRNLTALLYTEEMNKHNLKPVDFGISYMRKNGLIETGDFIITLECINTDLAIVRAYYLPPIECTKKFKYA